LITLPLSPDIDRPGGPAPILLVTGGSRGIGAATAVLAAQRGWDVVINFQHNVRAAEQVAQQVRLTGQRALTVCADVSDELQVMALFDRIDAELGRLDGLVNNAGVVDVACRVEAMTQARLQRQWAVNINGPFLCAREALRRMSTRQGGAGGVIVNVSSVAATLGGAGQYVDYAATKGAMDTFTVGLAREVAADGVRVNGVRPGLIDTDIHASGGQPDRAQRLASLVPLQRPGTAEEVANAIVWLLSPEASYTTGALLDVGGGR
jgi:NAD(P)-dependent dehydrogenase (short-subunit alcohol dehydrogenase family)